MNSRALSPFESFVSGLLRDGEASWPETWRGGAETTVLALAQDHGLEALLYAQAYDRPAWQNWPPAVREALKIASQKAAAAEVLQRSELIAVLSYLGNLGLRPMLFKGTPLAYSHYPAPHLRPRWDTDLFLPWSDKPKLIDALSHFGYQPQLSIPGDAIRSQSLLVRTDAKGVSHALDVHWKISNTPAFAGKLTYKELAAGATSVPQLGPSADAPDAISALLVACLHRAAHHFNCNRLIWLYDIHLIASKLQPSDLAIFSRRAFEKQIAAVCLDGLEVTKARYGTPLPEDFLTEFRTRLASGPAETTRVFLSGAQSRGLRLWRDVRATAGPLAALRLLRQHLFPPPSYMLKRYGTRRRPLLPFLYTRRLIQGIPKFFHRLK